MVTIKSNVLVFTVTLISLAQMSSTQENHCPLPNGKGGGRGFIELQISLCKRLSTEFNSLCNLDESITIPLLKGRLMYSKLVNEVPLLVQFFGTEICISWKYRWQLANEGRPELNRYSCKSICFDYRKGFIDEEKSLYHYETICQDSSGCKITNYLFRFNKELKAPPYCPIPKSESGSKKSMTLLVWNCLRAVGGTETKCGKEARIRKIIDKDKEPTTLGFKINSVQVMASFHGLETCVSFMYRHEVKGVNAEEYYKCEHVCLDGMEAVDETYHYSVFCSNRGCDGTHYRLKFTSEKKVKIYVPPRIRKSKNAADDLRITFFKPLFFFFSFASLLLVK